MIFNRNRKVKYWLGFEEIPLEPAIADLKKDFLCVLNASLECAGYPNDAEILLINLSHIQWTGISITADQWERFQIIISGNKLIIAGSDTRGLIFGIYHFSRASLGVDPLYFWIPSQPMALNKIDPYPAVGISATPAFKYRGWFLGAEDLLANWDYGGYREAEHWYGGRRKAISYEVYEKIFEIATSPVFQKYSKSSGCESFHTPLT